MTPFARALLLIGGTLASARAAPVLAHVEPPQAATLTLQPGELHLMASTVWGESRSQSALGQLAVAWVIVNRTREPATYGATVGQVVRQDRQFSVWLPRNRNRAKMVRLDETDPGYVEAMNAAVSALLATKADPTKGSTHFVNIRHPRPAWTRGMVPTVQIGEHQFYRNRAP